MSSHCGFLQTFHHRTSSQIFLGLCPWEQQLTFRLPHLDQPCLAWLKPLKPLQTLQTRRQLGHRLRHAHWDNRQMETLWTPSASAAPLRPGCFASQSQLLSIVLAARGSDAVTGLFTATSYAKRVGAKLFTRLWVTVGTLTSLEETGREKELHLELGRRWLPHKKTILLACF